MINTREQAVYFRLKAKYIGREKKRKIVNIYCCLPRRFKRKFWFISFFFSFFFFCFCWCFFFCFFVVFFFPFNYYESKKSTIPNNVVN